MTQHRVHTWPWLRHLGRLAIPNWLAITIGIYSTYIAAYGLGALTDLVLAGASASRARDAKRAGVDAVTVKSLAAIVQTRARAPARCAPRWRARSRQRWRFWRRRRRP